jgi:hypothetical protein
MDQKRSKFMRLSITYDNKISIKIHHRRKNDIGFRHDEKLQIIEFGKGYDKTKIHYETLTTNIFMKDIDICEIGMIEYQIETNSKISKKWFMFGDEYKRFNQNVEVLWPKIKYLYLKTHNVIPHDIYQIIVSNFIDLFIKKFNI